MPETLEKSAQVAWPHQLRGVQETLQAMASGVRRLLVTSPTGGGKTRMMQMLIRHWRIQGFKVALYTNRRMLLEQTSRVLAHDDIEHGIRAAGWQTDHGQEVQVCSIQTEGSRSRRAAEGGAEWVLHEAERLLIDEAHLQKEQTARGILARHIDSGASYVGFTATPLDLGDLYDRLVIAGTNSKLRACGALVSAHHYGPDEPDLRHIKKVPLGEELTEDQQRKVMMVPGIFGRVYDWWKKLNPDGLPTILFAPGVKESVWFCQQFEKEGVRAAHIDGQEVYVEGQIERTSREIRDQVLRDSRLGRIQIICNRFVLREGIDAPWLAHGILATVIGSLQSYLQAGGRLLRAYPDLAHVAIQDHGGNWWRHGSLNEDREWRLEYTSRLVAGLREDQLREKHQKEPVRCPNCARILIGLQCSCGFKIESTARSRPVIQKDGSLRAMVGDIFQPRRISKKLDAATIWEKCYYRCRNSGKTFKQAEALYAKENNWDWPSHDLPLMPMHEDDWYRRVVDVPKERLK
jgi:superfamily II DNA or RNA helicase